MTNTVVRARIDERVKRGSRRCAGVDWPYRVRRIPVDDDADREGQGFAL